MQGSVRIKTDPPDLREIREAISTVKNNNAPGVDNITAEILKVDAETFG
jgi:hypothetical protein